MFLCLFIQSVRQDSSTGTFLVSRFSNNRINLVIGHSRVDDIVRMFAERTYPAESHITSVIRAKGHTFRGVLSSMTNTSPTLKFCIGLFHFDICCNVLSYCFCHPDQNTSARYCTCFQYLWA